MRLYVLGPAFGLPSIDGECNAAVGLVKSHCDANDAAWELIISHEDDGSLPRLEDGRTIHHGYRNIVRHLNHASRLTPEQEANSTA